MTKTEQDAVAALALIDRLLDHGCTCPSECGGDATCFFCGAYRNDEHEKDCPYVAGCALRSIKQEPI